jgi:glycerol-3-phosphate acyltransferase PlsY
MDILIWTAIGYALGSIPFSVLIGRWVGGVDVRQYGDHNPGAANVMRATNWRWFGVAFLLDYFKGAVPVGIAWFMLGFDGWAIVPVALAPIFGHATSPWLGFRGGKAVAVTFGVWTGLTLGAGPIVLGLLLTLGFATLASSGWAVILTQVSFGIFLSLYYLGSHPPFLAVWLGNLAALTWKHWEDLQGRPQLRPWLTRWTGEGR